MSTATLERPTAPTSASPSADARSIHLAFTSAAQVHDGLESAVETLIETAAQEGTCGIKVTRLEPGRYTVALDESVPFGETHEDIAA
ncbi:MULTISPECIES: hypothetical protein [unclassified Arthrobacter]|uniref:hypothetical protein n=1 Tax=unclassified Arthrobacter TaxID=235627 RepID=UPI001F1683AC|nr:hypothetical protein [Arthrobacter sp. FW305-BF8]UKA54875.1 hypothetical protein LFT45_02680 [Arthrobacter sp. FW305-BF8]